MDSVVTYSRLGKYDGQETVVYCHESQPTNNVVQTSIVTVENNNNVPLQLVSDTCSFGAYNLKAQIFVKGETTEGWERYTQEQKFERLYQDYTMPLLKAIQSSVSTNSVEWYINDQSKTQVSQIDGSGNVVIQLDQLISALGLQQMSSYVERIVEAFRNGFTLTFKLNPYTEGNQFVPNINRFFLGNEIIGDEPIRELS
jgi:hypothetical protein